MLLFNVPDFLLPLTSFGGSALMVFRQRNIRRIGFMLALCSQPLWGLMAYERYVTMGKYDLILNTIGFTVLWCIGIYNHRKSTRSTDQE